MCCSTKSSLLMWSCLAACGSKVRPRQYRKVLQVERTILQRALELLTAVVDATTKGEPVEQPGCAPILTEPAATGAPADSKPAKGGKDAKGVAKKAPAAPAADTPPHAAGPPEQSVSCTLEAWHVDVVAQARMQAAQVLQALWQPADALWQVHLAMTFLHSPAADSVNGLADTPADSVAFTFGGARWLSLLATRCRLLLQLHDGAAAAMAAQQMVQVATAVRCRRSRAAALALEAASQAQRGRAAEALQLYSSAQSTLAALGDTGVPTAAVLLAHGDLRCSLGLRAEAQQLWSLAADMLRSDADARGLQQELVAQDRVNIYASDRALLVRALLCAARAHAWSGKDTAARALAAEAEALLPLCRVGPDVVGLVHLMHGRLLCCPSVLCAFNPATAEDAGGDASHHKAVESGGTCSVAAGVDELHKAATLANRELGVGTHILRDALLHGAMVHVRKAAASGGQGGVELSPSTLSVVEGLLQAVGSIGAARELLQGGLGALGAVDLAALPPWFVARVRGVDERHAEQSQRAKAAASPAEVQEAVWPCFRQLCGAAAAGSLVQHTVEHAVQQACVHHALMVAAPKYKETCCLARIPPLMPEEQVEVAEPALEAGERGPAVVVAQWLPEEAADPGVSTSSHSSMKKPSPTRSTPAAQVLQLPQPNALCTLVFVVRWAGGGPVAGGAAESSDIGAGSGDGQGCDEAGESAVSLAGSVTVENGSRWVMLQEVKRVRVVLEARASGTEDLLIQPAAEGKAGVAGAGHKV